MRVRDVVVVGAPRSGTSMLAGLFADAGHHAGRRLIPPTPSNPAGFFEDLDVNRANDDLLEAVADRPVPGTQAPPGRLRWIGAYPGPVRTAGGLDLAALVPPAPYVLKDPRLCYTLPAWRDVLGDPAVVVIVRHPDEVVASVGAMRDREPETFAGFDVTDAHLRAMWVAMHEAVLAWCDEPGGPEVAFVACDDVRSGEALARLGTLVGVELGDGTVRPDLHRERVRDVGVTADDAAARLWKRLEDRCRGEGGSGGDAR